MAVLRALSPGVSAANISLLSSTSVFLLIFLHVLKGKLSRSIPLGENPPGNGPSGVSRLYKEPPPFAVLPPAPLSCRQNNLLHGSTSIYLQTAAGHRPSGWYCGSASGSWPVRVEGRRLPASSFPWRISFLCTGKSVHREDFRLTVKGYYQFHFPPLPAVNWHYHLYLK